MKKNIFQTRNKFWENNDDIRGYHRANLKF